MHFFVQALPRDKLKSQVYEKLIKALNENCLIPLDLLYILHELKM